MSHRVAVYGSLRQGFGNYNGFLRQYGDPICRFRSAPGYEMFSLGGFPGVVRRELSDKSIVVEVYEVDDETKQRLDRLEGVPTFYYEDNIDTPAGPAVIYLLPDSVHYTSRPIVEDGDWFRFKTARSIC